MRALNRSSSLSVMIVVGLFYAAVGILFAQFAPVLLWRRLAWVVSAMAFGGHIAYEHYLRGSSSRRLAGCVSSAAAIGAFGLAAAANVHAWSVPAANHSALGMALVVWPMVVGIPAFVVGMIAAAIAERVWPRRNS